MAILAYVGVPGSGKSYEVVSSVIVPAVCEGRRVVTNIVGMDNDKLQAYCEDNFKKHPAETGSVISVSDEQVKQGDFFPYKGGENTFCQPGDLICIDEAWRIWENDKTIPDNHKSFISEHRHFTDPLTGRSCDLVVINQDVSGLPRLLKSRIESTFRMSKHLSLGLKNCYRVDVFTGVKLFKANRTIHYQRRYDKKIFPLYRSFDTQNGSENTVDKRQNVLASTGFKVKTGLMLFALVGGITWLIHSYHSMAPDTPESTAVPAPQPGQVPAPQQSPALSGDWQIRGTFTRNRKRMIVLADNNGHLRIVDDEGFMGQGLQLTGTLEGKKVTRFSGHALQDGGLGSMTGL